VSQESAQQSAPSDALARFEAVPRRLFLDSSTVQTLGDYGGPVFEGEMPEPTSRAHRIPGFLDDLEALHRIFRVNERGMFEFVLSPNSLVEADDKLDARHSRWVRDVLDPWLITVEAYRGEAFEGWGQELAARLDEPRFGYLSAKDKLLLQDAVALECDAFLTMEKKLARNAEHIEEQLGLKVLRPPDYWALLAPWAALYL
jgi:hypothetical protein